MLLETLASRLLIEHSDGSLGKNHRASQEGNG